MIAIILAAALVQDPEPLKEFEKEIDRILAACAGHEEKFTLGAAAECLQQTKVWGGVAERAGDAKSLAAIFASAVDRISKAVTALEERSSDLRRVQNQLERGKKRAASAKDAGKQVAALRYALERAGLITSAVMAEAENLVTLGLDCSKSGAYEEAEDALAEAESRMPSLRASTWDSSAEGPRLASVLLARVMAARGRIAEGAEALRRGIERNPGWLDRDLNFKESMHANPEDHAKFVKSLEAFGEDPDALLLLGHERYFSPDRAKAKDLFERVMKKRPDDRAAKKFLEMLAR